MGDDGAHQEEPPFPLTNVDIWVLSQTDDEFKKHDWADLEQIIGEALRAVRTIFIAPPLMLAPLSADTNNLSVLQRKPSDLRRYMKWTADIKAQYGSISQYILANRLPQSWGQPPFAPESQVPFESPADYKVLLNDWPYGLAPGITHIVVWSRTLIPTDPATGDMTPESRARVQDFVKRCFVDALGPGGEKRVLWFKNWVALQSVRSLEHFHVLVRHVGDDTLEGWTGERRGRPE
ncbi:hypothetical protein OCS_05782 [Ophiocordyceps sinensis CO18]|uniref:N-acetylglucosamine-induced protein 1 n=1 Tax=Ophiocordyceps sinensis (strain Co18 / CGMCC 3.14243) TaxID=911162 RepID=T5A7V4_OPHSC|nr:hypothetical protein OCS_05782 [Ophiocordyceps sinensis CO18]